VIDQAPTGRPLKLLAAVLAVACVSVVVVCAHSVYHKHRLLLDRRPLFQQVTELRVATRDRPLTDDEFEHALYLLICQETVTQQVAIVILKAEAIRTPKRRDQIIEELERAPNVMADSRQDAWNAVARLKAAK
jgi:hypothetical protein